MAEFPRATKPVSVSDGWAALPHEMILQHLAPSLDNASLRQERIAYSYLDGGLLVLLELARG